jgi:hypothetical protein
MQMRRSRLVARLAFVAVSAVIVAACGDNTADEAEVTTTVVTSDASNPTSTSPTLSTGETSEPTINPVPEQLADADPDDHVAEANPEVDSTGYVAECVLADDGNVEVELTNESPLLRSYRLNVGFGSRDGEQRATASLDRYYVRPGERSVWDIDWTWWIDSAPEYCEIVSVDQVVEVVDPDELADVISCEIIGETLTDVVAEALITNGSWESSDYYVWFAFTDADGVRRGDGVGEVEVVDPDQTAPVEVYGPSHDVLAGDYTCEAVAATRMRVDIHSTPWNLHEAADHSDGEANEWIEP